MGGSSPLILTITEQREATADECPNGGTVIEFSHSWQDVFDALSEQRVVLVAFHEDVTQGGTHKEGYGFNIVTQAEYEEGKKSGYYITIGDSELEIEDASSNTIIICNN